MKFITSKLWKAANVVGLSSIFVFALIGFVLTALFMASQFHITDVQGTIDGSSNLFNRFNHTFSKVQNDGNTLGVSTENSQNLNSDLQQSLSSNIQNYCYLKVVNAYAGDNARKVYDTYSTSRSTLLFENMINAVVLRESENRDFNSYIKKCDSGDNVNFIQNNGSENLNVFPWRNDQETWTTFTTALNKDEKVIKKAADLAGIEPRVLIAPLFVEQWREYTSERELYKSLLKPLQSFATSTNFSMGVMNIKLDTAKLIEENLKNQISPYYLGPKYEHLLDFASNNPDKERYSRLTNYSDHYYSYLYGSLYIAELEHQWAKMGTQINNRPEIVSTLFNIGFSHSNPNPNPSVGGAEINIGNFKYTFGGLAYEFYYSGELTSKFPYADSK